MNNSITTALMARIHSGESANTLKWYLPYAGREHVEYADWEEARRQSGRLSVILGLPEVDPISVKEA